MNSIQIPSDNRPAAPTKLDNAAKVLGILTAIGSTGAGLQNAFVNSPNQIETMKAQNQLFKNANQGAVLGRMSGPHLTGISGD